LSRVKRQMNGPGAQVNKTLVTLIERNPPPRGWFCIYYVSWSRALCKRFHDEMRRSQLVVNLLHTALDQGTTQQRKPPGGGGLPSINTPLQKVKVHFRMRNLFICRTSQMSHVAYIQEYDNLEHLCAPRLIYF